MKYLVYIYIPTYKNNLIYIYFFLVINFNIILIIKNIYIFFFSN